MRVGKKVREFEESPEGEPRELPPVKAAKPVKEERRVPVLRPEFGEVVK